MWKEFQVLVSLFETIYYIACIFFNIHPVINFIVIFIAKVANAPVMDPQQEARLMIKYIEQVRNLICTVFKCFIQLVLSFCIC